MMAHQINGPTAKVCMYKQSHLISCLRGKRAVTYLFQACQSPRSLFPLFLTAFQKLIAPFTAQPKFPRQSHAKKRELQKEKDPSFVYPNRRNNQGGFEISPSPIQNATFRSKYPTLCKPKITHPLQNPRCR